MPLLRSSSGTAAAVLRVAQLADYGDPGRVDQCVESVQPVGRCGDRFETRRGIAHVARAGLNRKPGGGKDRPTSGDREYPRTPPGETLHKCVTKPSGGTHYQHT